MTTSNLELKPGDLCVFQHTCQRGCHVERETIARVDEVSGKGDFAFVWGFEFWKIDGKWTQSTTRSSADRVRAFDPVIDEFPYNSTVGEVA